ncbi:DNA repair protein RAD51 homolog 3 isoform X7 [Coffea arabica]|uniref:DNA repair protein RAD51 homolog 3 n=1 Tax=Coffea arabica TaxID=13443 RepID=A0ABM4WHX4_COFAR
MEVSSLPISASHRAKLISAGYISISSLSSISPAHLARDLGISENEATGILKVASQRGGPERTIPSHHSIVDGLRAQTAWDMLHEEESCRRITTSCADLDDILGGGISCKEVTEIGGVPGIGKTQLGYTEQIAVINYLEKFISEHKDIKVVIVDSITFHFRQDFDDMALRTRLLGGMALKLMKLAKKFTLAVILLNQVTTKYSGGSFQLTLALGDSWSHACTNRIILYWNGNGRYAHIDKSPSIRSASAPYAVTGRGIRNLASNCKRVKLILRARLAHDEHICRSLI